MSIQDRAREAHEAHTKAMEIQNKRKIEARGDERKKALLRALQLDDDSLKFRNVIPEKRHPSHGPDVHVEVDGLEFRYIANPGNNPWLTRTSSCTPRARKGQASQPGPDAARWAPARTGDSTIVHECQEELERGKSA